MLKRRIEVIALPILLVFVAACSSDPDFQNNGTADTAGTDTGTPDTQSGDTGGVDSSDDGGDDTGTETDAGPCGGECTGSTPVCDEASGECVACDGSDGCGPDEVCAVDEADATNNTCTACVVDEDCADGVCDDGGDDDPSNNACVDCVNDEDCTEADAAQCDSSNTCVPCTEPGHCAGVEDAGVCDVSGGDGVCVECTVDEDGACEGTGECNPSDNTCLDRDVGTKSACDECAADSECGKYMRCVPMEFAGESLGKNYCMRIKTGQCEPPYVTLVNRETVDGETGQTFCSLKEALTTCGALKDLEASTTCTGTGIVTDCGLEETDDGVCASLGGFTQCTYECASTAECPDTFVCNTGPNPSYCDQPGT